MDEIGLIPQIQIPGTEHIFFTLNYMTLCISYVVMFMLILFAVTVSRRIQNIPGRYQSLAEFLVGSFDQLCRDTLGDKHCRTYFPLVMTLFIFILLSNWIVILPLPLSHAFFKEPTADINTPLALGTIVFFVVHYSGIKIKGFKSYIMEYFEPVIEINNIKIPNVLMFPLNLIGEISKVVSLSFRLFGNIMGGGIIIIVIGHLTHYYVVPILLNGFFIFFVGTVQAFVFSMLALTYIAVAITEE